jgi:phosphoglycolate phosphatase
MVKQNVKLAILSNKPDQLTQNVVSRLLAHWQFHPVIGARPGFPRKPDPAVALEIATNLNIASKQFLYVGDTDTDMKTAVAADMYPVGALWGFRTAEELNASGAKTLIHNPLELLQLL